MGNDLLRCHIPRGSGLSRQRSPLHSSVSTRQERALLALAIAAHGSVSFGAMGSTGLYTKWGLGQGLLFWRKPTPAAQAGSPACYGTLRSSCHRFPPTGKSLASGEGRELVQHKAWIYGPELLRCRRPPPRRCRGYLPTPSDSDLWSSKFTRSRESSRDSVDEGTTFPPSSVPG